MSVTTKKNPDLLGMFANAAVGVASALSIKEHMERPKKRVTRKRPTARKTNGTTRAKAAKRNPRRLPKGDVYVLTIKRGDDVESVYLHDGNADGFSKRFRTMSAAKGYATKNKVKLKNNPQVGKMARKRNVEGFVDGAGVFHPIRGTKGYDDIAAGEYKPMARKRVSKSAKKRLGITPTQPTLFNPAEKKTAPKSNGIISRAWARSKAKREYAKELRLSAAAERSRSRRKKAEAKARKNPVRKSPPRRRTFESFQGRRVENVRPLPISHHAGTSPKVDQLGKLHEIKLMNGQVLKFNPSRAVLAAKNGRMWIVGQKVAKADARQARNVLNPIGHVDHVVYETYKPHHGDAPGTHYIHKLGEEGGTLPLFCVDSEGFAVLKGGQYKIRPEGIRD